MPRKSVQAAVPATAGTRIIRTKLAPPRPLRRMVRREGVIQQLALGAQRRLTVLRAPAGFGKTTVLADWRERLIADRRLVAWVTLDADDNDAGQFVSYLAKALSDALGPLADGLPEFRADGEIASPKVSLTSVINALAAIDTELSLILDDYDRIKAGAVHDLLAFLLLHAPANLHLVIATRVEPPLPLAYLRAHDELVEIDAGCMRFGIEDTRCFVGDVAALKLDAGQTRALHEATEGWAAGLQIAAIALRGHGDAARLIASFSGKFRAVNEYLADSVLPNLDAGTIDFLLHTCILERLSGALCEHLTGIEDGAGMLRQLHQQNLFLDALDDENRWYRHHALFADFLRAQLEQRHPQQVRGLHERAAHWFAAQGLWAEAVRHALAAERLDLAAQWVELCAMREVEDSRVRNLLAWVRKLPDSAVRPRLRLRIAVGWASLLTIELDEAMRVVDGLSRQMAAGEFPADPAIDAELLALRFCITALQDDTAGALVLGERYLAHLSSQANSPGQDDAATWVHQAALNGLTHCYQKAGDLARARAVQQPEWYPPSTDPRRNLFTNSYRATTLGACDIREARLHEGARQCRAALHLAEANAGRRSAAATLVACSLAAVHYEWNELIEVEQLLADRRDIVDDACYLDSVRSAYLSLARLSAARGDYDAAHALLERGQLVAARRRWPRLSAVCLAEQVRLWLRQDRPRDADRAQARLQALTPAAAPPTSAQSETWRVRCIGQARWLLHLQRATEAASLLRGVLADENPATSPYPTARTRLLLAIALDQAGAKREALAEAGALLQIAAGAGMIRSIADEGAAAARLLERFVHTPEFASTLPRTPWRDRLFNALDLGATPSTATRPRTAQIEPLSQRERDVLSLVAQGLSNEQTARTLMLATETVKWHLKNVYSKLGVSRRTLAVHRARQLDLIVESRLGL